MDTNLLKAYLIVVECGSMAEAASSLGCSAPAVSQQVARLETELGAVLLERSRSGVVPTQVGSIVYQRAQSVLGALGDMRLAIDMVGSEQLAPVRLEAFPSAGVHLLPYVLRRLQKDGAVPISLVQLNDDDPFGKVSSGVVDLTIGYEYDHVPIKAPASVVIEHLGRDVMDVIVPVVHPLAKKRKLHLRDLRDEDWALFPPENVATISAVTSAVEEGFQPRVAFESGDYQVVQAIVSAGGGVSLMPRMITSSLSSKSVAVRPLQGEPLGRKVFVAYRKTFDRSRLAAIIDAIQHAFTHAISS